MQAHCSSVLTLFFRGQNIWFEKLQSLWVKKTHINSADISSEPMYALKFGQQFGAISALVFVCELLKWIWKDFKVCRCDLEVLLLINLIACSWKAPAFIDTFIWLLLFKYSSKYSNNFRKMVVKKLYQDGIKPFQVYLTNFSVIVSIVLLKLWYR